MRTLPAVLLCLLLTARSSAAQTAPLPADSVELGRSWTRWFISGQVDSLWPHVLPGTGPLASKEALAAAMRQLEGQVSGVAEDRFLWRGRNRQFRSDLHILSLPEPLVLRWIMRPDGKIGGIGISPLSQVPPVDSLGPPLRKPH